MKCTRIYYEKCFNLGNYQNEKIGVEIELAEDESATKALEAAKKFVESHNPKASMKLEEAKRIVASPNANYYQTVLDAQKIIDNAPYEDDLPF
jgi:thioredoxin-like negative regulator of GroEL